MTEGSLLDPDTLLECSGIQALTYLFQLGNIDLVANFDATHILLERCGGFRQVFQIAHSAVPTVPALTPEAAEYIALLTELMGRFIHPQPINRPKVTTSDHVARLLRTFFQKHTEETLYLLCLDPTWRLHAGGILAQGSVWKVCLPMRRMLDLALRHNTRGVILAHNHPNDLPDFSDSDIQSTWQMSHHLKQINVSLLDHLLFVDGKARSMRCALESLPGQPSPFSPMSRFPLK